MTAKDRKALCQRITKNYPNQYQYVGQFDKSIRRVVNIAVL